MTNFQRIPVGRFNIQELDRTGSQYLANLSPTPEESDEEQEPLTFYQESFQYEYSSDNDLAWDTHYTENEMTIEEIREDGSSIVLSSYSKEANAVTIFQAYQYSQQELYRLYLSNIVVKQVIAGQPIKRGESKCTDAYYYGKTVDHHIHTYCKCCKQNLFTKEIVHDCIWEIG